MPSPERQASPALHIPKAVSSVNCTEKKLPPAISNTKLRSGCAACARLLIGHARPCILSLRPAKPPKTSRIAPAHAHPLRESIAMLTALVLRFFLFAPEKFWVIVSTNSASVQMFPAPPEARRAERCAFVVTGAEKHRHRRGVFTSAGISMSLSICMADNTLPLANHISNSKSSRDLIWIKPPRRPRFEPALCPAAFLSSSPG